MRPRPESPPFGQADLTNCERELIHLSGSIQPHGVLLVLSEPRLVIVQASANVDSALGTPLDALLGHPVDVLGSECAAAIRDLLSTPSLGTPLPTQVLLRLGGRDRTATLLLHRPPEGGVIIEFEDLHEGRARRSSPALPSRLAGMVTRLSAAHSIPALADLVVEELQDLLGYDRVMVYRFDEAGHGEIIAEAKRAEMESYLHRHYPATDIPQRARELYLRNKVRLLVDVGYTPVPILPRLSPVTGDELDLSLAGLRSISPLHTEYLQNMGVAATLVASLVHEGRLWGLIACHHREVRYVAYDLRAACELVAEVVSTRISALEHFAEAQAEVLVRRLEHRLIEESAADGDWRRALFDAPRQLLAPVNATGAALLFEGEVHTTGDVPSTPDLRALFRWLDTQGADPVFATSSIARAHPPWRH
ncbi:MAG: GAF domain-containing protein [Gemmatimonadaceae bacterium]|nr:GAF domain-containing protein [Gemmatimonadaceae bacterium]